MRRLIIMLAAFTVAAIPVSADVIHVPGDYDTIQAGIDAAVDGDTVLVADGTYTGDGNRDMDFGGKAIVVKSENGPEFTIIDCEGANYDEHRAFKFQSGETAESILEGFTIQNGWALWDGPDGTRCGGAIFCSNSSSPGIIECIFSFNYAAQTGGAIYCTDYSSPTLTDCVFLENEAGEGGGLGCTYESSPILSSCIFDDNLAVYGGGVYCFYDSSPMLTNCTFSENTGASDGGGLFSYGLSSASFTDCDFVNNIGGSGGAVGFSGGNPVFSNCEFYGNSASGGGAAVFSNGSPTLTNSNFSQNIATSGGALFCRYVDITVTNCVFSENSAGAYGGALYCRTHPAESVSILNCTFFSNSAPEGGGIFCLSGSSPYLENSIIAFSPDGESIYGGTSTLLCCDIYGNAGGDWVGYIAPQYGENGNFSEDPLFCDTSYNVLTLTSNSPCAPENNSCGVLIGAFGVSCSGMYNFSLIIPPTDSLYLHTPDEFMWHSTTDVDSGFPASYRFYIDDDPLFGSPDSSDVLSDTTYSLSDTLSRSILYYWRVLAFNDFAIPRFSAETWNLYVDGYPGMTEIIAPCDGSVVDSTTYFAWLITTDPDSFDAVTYSIQMDDDPLFDSPEIDQSGLGSGLLLDDAFTIRLGELNGFENLIPGTVYYWRVRSDDLYGLSSNWTDGTNYVIFLVRTGINDDEDRLPNTFFISQNYPNPFNARTTIEYGLPEASHVTIKIYNMLGEMVETLLEEGQSAGYHRIIWDAQMQPSGIYFYWVHAGDHIETNKMVLLK